MRPTSFEVNYKIDGEQFSEKLLNINGGNKEMIQFEDKFMEVQVKYGFTCAGVCSWTGR